MPNPTMSNQLDALAYARGKRQEAINKKERLQLEIEQCDREIRHLTTILESYFEKPYGGNHA